jgi:acetyltransferase-like isoleucine patch superfamily enzyme
MFRGLWWRVTTTLASMILRSKGASLGTGIRFLGLPIATGDLRRVSLGNRVTFASEARSTALGVRGPCILRILGPDGRITLGDDIGASGVVICSAVSVTIGARCLIGADVMIFDTDFHNHAATGRRYSKPDWLQISRPVVIEEDVFIGTRSIVSKGAHIGRGSIIAAGSVVVGAIPPMSIAAGVPAKVIGTVPEGPAGVSPALAAGA